MKFLHLVATDYGGAGIAAWRMHDTLRKLGHVSHMLALESRTSDVGVLTIGADSTAFKWRRLVQKAWLKVSSRPDGYFQNQLLTPGIDAAELVYRAGLKPDIIVVHFISHFLAPDDVLALQRVTGAPVLWNLLDMALMTGGCHYAWHCDGYIRSCGRCPALRLRGANDLSAQIWAAKQRAMGETRGWVVAGSSLLARQAAASSLFRDRRIEKLLLGVSPTMFAPGDRISLRQELGVGGAERLVFFGAQRFDQRRKGMHLLMDAFLYLQEMWPSGTPLPVLLCAGNAADFTSLRDKGFRLVDLGFIGSAMLAKAYAAADVFACPSVEDSGPMMINESMMSGTPVVAFRMGVAEDLIEDGASGIIASLGDTRDFAAGLQSVLLWDTPRRAIASAHCREVALAKCFPERQAQRFVEIARALHVAEVERL
jgi:glycosyltransferase involved in cell wall biosynthesis